MVSHSDELVGFDDEQTAAGGALSVGSGRYARRLFDFVAAAFSILLFAPILLITSIAIKLESPGPIVVRETRFGYGKRTIRVYRFRVAPRADTQPFHPRLTRVGRMLHQTGIAELPELFSVLFGDMSIVGPRPYLDHRDLSQCPDTPLLNNIKPGMIDWACPTGFRTVEQRFNDDLYCAANRSPHLDIMSIFTVLFGEKSARRPLQENKGSASFARRKVARAK